MKTTCISTAEGLEAWRDRWERLHAAVEPAVPFTSPQWVLPWLRHFARRSPLLKDHVRCWFFEEGDRLVGVAPMLLSCRPGVGPVRFGELQAAGLDRGITELNTVLFDPQHEEQGLRELALALAGDESWDVARWWAREGASGHAGRHRGERPMYVLELPASWETFKSSRSRNIKESLRKCYNSLKRDGHTFSFRVRTGADELGPALERFFALHRERAAISDGVAHPDWFAPATAQAFIRDAMLGFAQQGAARVFELEIAGEVVASRLGFVSGRTLYLYYSGYRATWGRYSVMTTVTAEAIRAAIAEGLTRVNLSFGRDVSKTRWGPSEIVYREAVHVAPRLRSRAFELLEPRLRAVLRTPALARIRDLLSHG